MKKALIIVSALALTAVLSLSSCGGKTEKPVDKECTHEKKDTATTVVDTTGMPDEFQEAIQKLEMPNPAE